MKLKLRKLKYIFKKFFHKSVFLLLEASRFLFPLSERNGIVECELQKTTNWWKKMRLST